MFKKYLYINASVYSSIDPLLLPRMAADVLAVLVSKGKTSSLSPWGV